MLQKQKEVRPACVLAIRERSLLAKLDKIIIPFEEEMSRRAAAANHDCGSDLCEDCTFDRMFR